MQKTINYESPRNINIDTYKLITHRPPTATSCVYEKPAAFRRLVTAAGSFCWRCFSCIMSLPAPAKYNNTTTVVDYAEVLVRRKERKMLVSEVGPHPQPSLSLSVYLISFRRV